MIPQALGPRADIALLALRLVFGAAFALHGIPKMHHMTMWANQVLPGTPPWLQAVVAVVEFAGGIATFIGLLVPLCAFLIACDMVVAILFVHIPQGATFVSMGGPSFELPLIYLVVAFTLLILGPGRISLDAALFRARAGRRH